MAVMCYFILESFSDIGVKLQSGDLRGQSPSLTVLTILFSNASCRVAIYFSAVCAVALYFWKYLHCLASDASWLKEGLNISVTYLKSHYAKKNIRAVIHLPLAAHHTHTILLNCVMALVEWHEDYRHSIFVTSGSSF
jgi:hypothetical protein